MSRGRLEQARQLIAAQRYDEARALLRTLGDDPQAQALLAEVERLAADDTLHVTPRGVAATRRTGPPPEPDTGTHVRQLGVYEMQWDCKFCGTTKLLGKTHRFCPNCGAAQDPNTRYFPSDAERVAVQDHVYVGADVICSACSTLNSGNAQFCMQCGAPLTDAARAKTLADQTRAAGEQFESSGPRDVAKEQFEAEMQRVGVMPTPGAAGTSARQKAMLVLGAAALVVLCVAAIFIFTRTREASVAVTGHTWEWSVQIEAYGPHSESAWCDQMPDGAYSISRSEEVRSYRQVPDGEECSVRRIDNGDGTYREQEECRTRYRDEPVYDTRCYYTIDRWSYARTATASGGLSDPPHRPVLNLASNEREAGSAQRYTVHLRETEGEATYDCAFATPEQWQRMAVGSRWTMDVGAVLGNANCDSLQPAG